MGLGVPRDEANQLCGCLRVRAPLTKDTDCQVSVKSAGF